MTTSAGRAEDEREIEQLIYRYNATLDATDYRGWADCFTAEGIFRGAHADWVVHRDFDLFTAAAIERRGSAAPSSRHFVTNVMIEVDGSVARSRCHLMVTALTAAGRPAISLTGEYEDYYAKQNGRWLFTERRVHVDGWQRDWPALGEPPEPGDRPYERARLRAAASGQT
jgi:3-phenylpropionate/cinnamic acid dioxygenase small subunit